MTSASIGGSASAVALCDGLLAKLTDVMDFLQFAKTPNAAFRGVVRALGAGPLRENAVSSPWFLASGHVSLSRLVL